ncbi:MAG: class I SAM-dependent methyltransferase, partial [Mesorhizobium sp.]
MSTTELPASHAELMDGVYRWQRHIYDLTRKYYLLGRDRLIDGLDVPQGGTVLELGCGTGRNIALAARRFPDARFFGLDISAEMLETANAAIAREGLSGKVKLAPGDATDFDAKALFDVEQFDRVFVSYSLSMIPGWEKTVSAALAALAPGGSLHVVDFGQQEGLPRWFRTMLR